MSNSPQSSDEKLRDLAKAIDGLERNTTPPALPVKTIGLPSPELGTKTRLAVQVMAWGFRVSWGIWVLFAFILSPLRQISDLIVVPISALLCWVIFQGHKLMLVAAARKISRYR